MKIPANLRHKSITCAILLLLGGPLCIRAKKENDKWQQVYTSEAFVTHINASSLRLGPEGILKIQSRTILSDPVRISRNTGPKYKSTLQTIDYKLGQGQYRISETVFLDSSGKVLLESVAASDWRVIKEGGVIGNVLQAVSALQPFGSWKITTYRYAEGNEVQPPPELEKLVGKRAEFCFDCAKVESRVCSSASFQDRRYTNEEFAGKLGVELKAVGIKADFVETIEVKCVRGEWRPAHSLLLKVDEHEMLMLWDGVFLVLKRERHWIGVSPPKNRSKPEFKVPHR